MRTSYTRGLRVLPALASSSSSSSSIRPLHTSSSLHARRADGSWVSDQPRIRPHPTHFDPVPFQQPKSEDAAPADRLAYRRIEPFVNPAQGTHTILKQKQKVRMQFQQEPATRTLVKTQGENGRINDYSRAEVFTRAPWPCYREIIINRAAALHTLNPATIQQLTHFTQSIDVNADITATMMLSRHINTTGRPANYQPGVDKKTGLKLIPYEKTFCAGMDMHTLLNIIKQTRAQKQQEEAINKAMEENNDEQSDENEIDEDEYELDDASSTSLSPSTLVNPQLSKYFRSLYNLSWQIHKTRYPLVIVLDGLTVGAGAGFALQSRYRVATENTRISFPQASLGWFPDAGASYTLSHLDGNMGMFLALSGWQVRALDAIRLGLATHYCEGDELHRFGKRIGDSSLTYQFAEDTIEQSFGMFNTTGPSSLPLPLHQLHDVLDDIFGDAESVEHIFTRLQARIQTPSNNPAETAFLNELLQKLLSSSPQSLKVTFQLINMAKYLPLEKCIKLEYRLAHRLLCNLSDPLQESELFQSAGQWKFNNLKEVANTHVQQLFKEDDNQDKEFNLNYDPKKQPTWYI